MLRTNKPNFLFLFETLSNASKIESLRICFGISQCFFVDCVGHSGGLTVFWRRHVNCEILSYSQNHMDVLFSDNGVASWRLSCFYGFLERSRRKDPWILFICWLLNPFCRRATM